MEAIKNTSKGQNAHLSSAPDSRTSGLHANGYQSRKAREIAASLIRAASGSSVGISELPGFAARMTEANWRTVSFQAGVAVADHTAKVLTIAYLLKAAK